MQSWQASGTSGETSFRTACARRPFARLSRSFRAADEVEEDDDDEDAESTAAGPESAYKARGAHEASGLPKPAPSGHGLPRAG